MNNLSELKYLARDWALDYGMSDKSAFIFAFTINMIILIVISLIAWFFSRLIILKLVEKYVKKSKNTYDDVLMEKKVFAGIAQLIPAWIIKSSLEFIADGIVLPLDSIKGLIKMYMAIVLVNVISRLVKASIEIGHRVPRFKDKPLSSYGQVINILNYLTGAIIILSILTGASPVKILTTFGAATAVMLLVFRDTILGLVASIQISANDMIRLGDWVSMDKYGADGDVMEINLTTIKVRNFDKTITTVPTYALVSDSFKNWRGMQSKGVRRIKRTIYVDLQSIKFANNDLLKRLENVELIKAYISERQDEINQYNIKKKVNKEELINGRHMTNIGIFRKYILEYISHHPKIAHHETMMVRQLQPTERGLPLEVYAFSNDINWVNYETIQSDIFDHLLSAIHKFDLETFQNLSSNDLKVLGSKFAKSDPSTLS